MRTFPIVLVAGLALLAVLAPTANAGHANGVCWHEYVEAAIYAVQTKSVKAFLETAGACVRNIPNALPVLP